MNKKKILFLIHTLGAGGAEKILVNIANNLNKEKFEVTVMTVIDTGIHRESLNKDVIYKTIIPLNRKKIKKKNESGSLQNKTSRLKNIAKSCYQFIWRHMNTRIFYRLFIKEKYDIEVAFLEGICAKIISGSSNANSTKISWIHVDLVNERKSEKVFKNLEDEKKYYSKFDKVVGVSEHVSKKFIQKFGLKCETIYNPVDSQDILYKSSEIINERFDNIKAIKMCSIGRLAHQKGYDRLIEVLHRLKQENYDFFTYIIGVGPEEEILKDKIKKYSLESSIKLLGYRSNPYPYLKLSDVFISSSRAEGFSTVATEAVILNIPSLVTDCSGMKELFGDNNEYGLVVENSNDGLYTGIKNILDDPQLLKEYKKKSEKLIERFDLQKSVLELESFFIGD